MYVHLKVHYNMDQWLYATVGSDSFCVALTRIVIGWKVNCVGQGVSNLNLIAELSSAKLNDHLFLHCALEKDTHTSSSQASYSMPQGLSARLQ